MQPARLYQWETQRFIIDPLHTLIKTIHNVCGRLALSQGGWLAEAAIEGDVMSRPECRVLIKEQLGSF